MTDFESTASAMPVAAKRAPEPKPTMLSAFMHDLLMVCILATASLSAGLVLNEFRDQPLPLVYTSKDGRMQRAVSQLAANNTNIFAPAADEPAPVRSTASDASPRVIDLVEFRAFVDNKRGLALDARPEIFYRLGHVPGALSVSREEFERDYAAHRSLLEVNRKKPIAVYCSSASCEDSQMVADALAKLVYDHILVFKGGWDEWTQAGLPQEEERK